MVSLGVEYGAVALRCVDGEREVVSISGTQTFKNEKAHSEDKLVVVKKLDKGVDKVFFRNRVESLPMVEKDVTRNQIYLDYSVDGINYENVLSYEAVAGRWVGVKNGIFACHETDGSESAKTDGKNAIFFRYFSVDDLGTK